MKHLTDEELIAYAYGEGNEAAVEQHLERCAECARSHSALRSDLAEMKYAEPPARDARYGERVWETLAGRLPTYEAKGWSWLQQRSVERLELCGGVRVAGGLRLCRRASVGTQAGAHDCSGTSAAGAATGCASSATGCGGGAERPPGPVGTAAGGAETCGCGQRGDGVSPEG